MGNTFIEAIKREQKRIQRLISLQPPKQDRGVLILQPNGRHLYAYERVKVNNKPKKNYLGTLDSPPVREIFSVRLNSDRLKRLKKNRRLLQKLAQEYQDDSFEELVSDMPRAYQKVARANCFDQRYEELRAWANANYPKNTYPFPRAEIYAKDGTRLRSKGECIWYNLLQERGILFRNDCKMVFRDDKGNEKILYPDFLIQCYDGTFIIIEHLGKLGNLGYAIDFGEHCHWYLLGGFIFGKNLFVTSDDKYYGTDSQMIEKMVDQIEQLFYGF